MASPGSAGRKRTTERQTSAEDQALNQIAREAESRLAARRAARAEAREIRMREIERQRKEAEEKEQTRAEASSTRSHSSSVGSSRRGSDDSTSAAPSGNNIDEYRQLKKEIMELEEKYKKTMMNNAQLDNEKQTYRFEVDLLKDRLDDMEEQLLETTREHKERCRELEQKKRDYVDLDRENEFHKQQLELRDKLIEEYGLVFLSNDTVEDEKDKKKKKKKRKEAAAEPGTTALVTPDALQILQKVEGNLDERLKSMADEKQQLEKEVKKLRQQLEDEKERNELAEKYSSPRLQKSAINGPSDQELLDSQMDAQRQVNEYKFKLKKAEQDITTLEGNVIRLDSQVKRFRSAAENSEKVEDELKAERRKLQRELREAQSEIEELQTANQHLQKRLEKIKSARNALLKP